MNKTIWSFTRKKIKEGLSKLTDKHKMRFKKIYSHNDLTKSIDNIVDNIPLEHLGWALTQIENTLRNMDNKGELK